MIEIMNGYTLTDGDIEARIEASDFITQIHNIKRVDCRNALRELEREFKIVYANYYDSERTLSIGMRHR